MIMTFYRYPALDSAVELAIESLEKQIPEKPEPAEKENTRYVMSYICPSCKNQFTGTGIASFCYHCGQALDWSDE